MMRKKLTQWCGIFALLPFSSSFADPFTDCPSEAFLVQDSIAKMYSVHLATGYYSVASTDLGTQNKLNALAFNFHDNYLYAWSYEHATLARIGNDFQIEPLSVSLVSTSTFYVGDIALNENVYYSYRNGSSHGLYKIPLDSSDPNYLVQSRVVDGSSLNMKIFDLAFHPTNGYAYSVDSQGVLHQIDVSAGTNTSLGNVGVTGTFGAVYFDVNGTFYISRNSDGNIFRITVTDPTPTAEFFAYGPNSGNNDGARCAMAEIVDDSIPATIDFGDAPDTFGTSLASNGARHQVGSLFLGESVDAETDAQISPLSDDATDASDDEDGVNFVTSLEVGYDAMVAVTASEAGYLNAWIDFDSSGTFESSEQIITDRSVVSGSNSIGINVSESAIAGEQWARFRFSSSTGVGATGGVSDGEVEDYLVDIVEPDVSLSYFPSANSWVTLAYEDNWPVPGDYDLNDFVVHYRVQKSVKNGEGLVKRTIVRGEVVSMGASYHNGFAIRLEGISPNDLNTDRVKLQVNGVEMPTSPLESGRSEAIFIISEDLKTFVESEQNCTYHRTRADCQEPLSFTFKLTVPFANGGIDENSLPDAPYDPFIFAAEGYDHGYLFGEPPGRTYEIHLGGKSPTEAFNTDYFGRGVDDSDPESGRYFVNTNGMPWAIMINSEWIHPVEYIDVKHAYPEFEDYVTSGGVLSSDWFRYGKATTKNIYDY